VTTIVLPYVQHIRQHATENDPRSKASASAARSFQFYISSQNDKYFPSAPTTFCPRACLIFFLADFFFRLFLKEAVHLLLIRDRVTIIRWINFHFLLIHNSRAMLL